MTSKYEGIANALIHDILSNRYQVGDRLPSERDMAARFETNRGAVREAMKKLEHLGLAEIQPGGARVKDRTEASLDVIGHLLSQGASPDPVLVDQILVVMSSLMTVAAEQVTELATDDELQKIRDLARPLVDGELDEEAHALARFELFGSIMETSGNLPLQLIAKTIFEQFGPHLLPIIQTAKPDREAFRVIARQLEQGLTSRDLPAVRATFAAISDLNRQNMMKAIENAQVQKEANQP